MLQPGAELRFTATVLGKDKNCLQLQLTTQQGEDVAESMVREGLARLRDEVGEEKEKEEAALLPRPQLQVLRVGGRSWVTSRGVSSLVPGWRGRNMLIGLLAARGVKVDTLTMDMEGRMEELVMLAEVPGILELLAPECGEARDRVILLSLRKGLSNGKVK